jgi:hypothetical protein
LRCPSFHPCKEWLYKIFIQHGKLRDKYPSMINPGIYNRPMFIRQFSKVSNNWFYHIIAVLRKILLSTLSWKPSNSSLEISGLYNEFQNITTVLKKFPCRFFHENHPFLFEIFGRITSF